MSPHKWCLKFEDGFLDQFSNLDQKTKKIGYRQIQALLEADNPYGLPKVLKVKSQGELRRIRVGNYRLFFIIEDGEAICEKSIFQGVLWLVKIKDRKDAYR